MQHFGRPRRRSLENPTRHSELWSSVLGDMFLVQDLHPLVPSLQDPFCRPLPVLKEEKTSKKDPDPVRSPKRDIVVRSVNNKHRSR